MEQYKKTVLEVPVKSQGSAIFSHEEVAENATDKAIHFTHITADDREKLKKWLANQNGSTEEERFFLRYVKIIVQMLNYDYWIANLEPSVAKGKIYYAKGENVGVFFSCNQYKQMAEAYAPERGSRMAQLDELLIWYALRIANGFWTLDYVVNDSSSAGNYWNGPNSAKSMEKTGERKCGGYRDGQGNTRKIVALLNDFVLVGGSFGCDGKSYPVAYVDFSNVPDCYRAYNSGVVVLTK